MKHKNENNKVTENDVETTPTNNSDDVETEVVDDSLEDNNSVNDSADENSEDNNLDNSENNNPENKSGKGRFKYDKEKNAKFRAKLWMILPILLILYMLLTMLTSEGITSVPTISTVEFNELLEAGRIEEVNVDSSNFYSTVVYRPIPEKTEQFGNGIVYPWEVQHEYKKATCALMPTNDYLRDLAGRGVNISYTTYPQNTAFNIILSFVPYIIFIIIIFFMMNKTMVGVNKQDDTKVGIKVPVRFSDIAGMTEEKEELLFTIKSLKEAEKMKAKGVRPVKGILLEGPPGVGKTLLAKAVAGEAGVNFLAYSGSDFVEMFVGLGASRIRNMYKKAEALKPCVVFIDEIDVLGARRIDGPSGGDRENNQTLVALLEKMDGVNTESGILFMAATNRADILDPALTRPGRFDKVIHIGPPKSKEDREAIVELHLKNKTVEEGLTVEQIAKMCFGLTGAEIEQVLNDAVIESFKSEKDGVIDLDSIDKAVMKTFAKGIAKGGHKGENMERVSIHELGHAMMNHELGRKVVKVSVQPYTSGVGGVTMIDGDSAGDSGLRTRQEIIDDIKVLYAGKVAEKVILGDASTGASNDLMRATELLKNYVGTWSMDDDMLITLNTLTGGYGDIGQNNQMLVERMNKKATEIYNEVYGFLSQEHIVNEMKRLNETLMKAEVIYDFDKVVFSDSVEASKYESSDAGIADLDKSGGNE